MKCLGTHPGCGEVRVVSTFKTDGSTYTKVQCPNCLRTRELTISPKEFIYCLYIQAPIDIGKDLLKKLTLHPPPPFGAGPATQGIAYTKED